MGLVRRGVRGRGRARLVQAARRGVVGPVRHPGAHGGHARPGPRREGRDRARLRDGIRLRMDGPARREAGRDRQLAPPARDGDPAAARARARVPAAARQRGGGARRSGVVRLRDQRVRRRPVGRSGALGPRGRPPPAAGRPAACADQQRARLSRLPRRRGRTGRTTTPAAAVRDGPDDVGATTRASSSTSPMATGSGCSRRSGFEILELREPRIPEGATTTYDWMPYEWARQWPCEEIWKVRKRR